MAGYETALYAAGLQAGYDFFMGGGLNAMQAAITGVGAYVGEMVGQKVPQIPMGDAVGAGAGAYVGNMFVGSGGSAIQAIAGVAGQKLGDMYPMGGSAAAS